MSKKALWFGPRLSVEEYAMIGLSYQGGLHHEPGYELPHGSEALDIINAPIRLWAYTASPSGWSVLG